MEIKIFLLNKSVSCLHENSSQSDCITLRSPMKWNPEFFNGNQANLMFPHAWLCYIIMLFFPEVNLLMHEKVKRFLCLLLRILKHLLSNKLMGVFFCWIGNEEKNNAPRENLCDIPMKSSVLFSKRDLCDIPMKSCVWYSNEVQCVIF